MNVNSLEQLISINQNLQTALGISGGSSSTGAAASTGATSSSGAKSAASSHAAKAAAEQAVEALSKLGQGGAPAAAAATAPHVTGNLSVPEAKPAAMRVAGALSGAGRR